MGITFTAPDLLGRQRAIACGDDEIEVRALDKTIADEVIKAGHYSGSVVWSSSEHFGVWSGGVLIGALQYGPGMNPASGCRVVKGSTADTWLELNRMWLSDEKPQNCATRAIAFSLRLIRHWRPRVEWVQSFADERCGKLGAVYQAASFLYCGSHVATFYELDGEWYHKSMRGRARVDKRGWGCGPKIAHFLDNQHRATARSFRQFRYVRLLRARRSRLLLNVLPYPKANGQP